MNCGRLLRVVLLGVLATNCGSAADTPRAKNPPPAIREFDLGTLSNLGRAIYRHDQWAWGASDLLLAQKSAEELTRDGVAGWIIDEKSEDSAVVRFLRANGGNMEAAYDVVLAKGKAPKVGPAVDRALTPEQKLRAQALKTAEKEFLALPRPWCGGRPNSVILADPAGGGFLVYFLRPKPSMEAVPSGGHYRFSVAADATRVTQVDQLFVSCLTLNRNDVPAGGKIEMLVMGQVVGELPLETTVFLSLQEKLPFGVVTRDGKMWRVADGKIEPLLAR